MTRTDIQSLTRNKSCQLQRSMQKPWRMWGKKAEFAFISGVCDTGLSSVRGKSATPSMILPWFREFVHVPVRQHNNSAGNQINKSKSQTQIRWYRHADTKMIHSYSVMKYSSWIQRNIPTWRETKSLAFACHFQTFKDCFTCLSFIVYLLHYFERRFRQTPVCMNKVTHEHSQNESICIGKNPIYLTSLANFPSLYLLIYLFIQCRKVPWCPDRKREYPINPLPLNSNCPIIA